VLGVVFGAAVDDNDTGFVLTANEVSRQLAQVNNTEPVPTGPACRRHSRVDDAAADAAEEERRSGRVESTMSPRMRRRRSETVRSGRVDDAAADAAEEERDGCSQPVWTWSRNRPT
jgi:hypothetical protein